MRTYRSRIGCALLESMRHIGSMREDMNTDYGNRLENIGNSLLRALYTACLPVVFCDALVNAEFSEDPRGWHWSPVPKQKYPTI